MNLYNKKKGIIYVNNCTNAENLYKLLNNNNDNINIYIFTSKQSDNIEHFEYDKNKALIVVVDKISYGYDCD